MIFCEFGPGGRTVLFRDAEVVLAHRLDQVLPALARAESARRAGKWIAGWIGYEAGYAFEDRLRPLAPATHGPLLALGIHDAPCPADDFALPVEDVQLTPLRPLVSRKDYGAAFRRVQDHIGAGDCYQINLTFPLETRLARGTPAGLYRALRASQPVGYGAFADLGGPVVLSRSPELFFQLDGAGGIEARPMKGTAPRDPDPERDAALARALAASEKNQAENLMIVDLLRNDIGRISRPGSVRVPELFAIDSFATVHQMSSRVTGQLAAPPDLPGLMRALFPCGSITGAPKIRAMEIIREVEPFPRGVYCGALGWMAPDGAACFSVAIRTLSVWPDGRVTLNAGGGVVQDSTADAEWEEALWKTRFAQGLTTPGCG
ncbi:aminodeoxychorismate synthase component I [Paracoccus alkenifer]|uniref:Aminodeoxychorismate synthase, subunit I n=1 Tax=Paracoccus alkenifer TaxID=65735 RepID=A0A1H6KK12_9RHOB|nr:aminodeoxychorismate synthase, subunit I [Paracoccus alkenifer]